ncbi:MAG: DUF421 domain-containing protein [Pseudolabrys sp.]
MQWLYDLGLSAGSEVLNWWQLALRAAVIYVALIACVRVGKKRFLGRATAFDVILIIVIGSIAARAITGATGLAGGIAAVLALVMMHWLFSLLSRSSSRFGGLIKGTPTPLIKNGKLDRQALWREHMSDDDLDEDLREFGVMKPSQVKEARLERDGKLSVVKR